MRVVIAAASFLLIGPALATAQRTEPAGALSYDLAFDRREFPWSTTVSVSRDGRLVAYDVRQPPADSNLSARYQPNGTPSSAVGSHVYVTDRTAGTTVDACPGGSCWRAVLSPNGRELAFYSDAQGAPHLWVYDLAARRARRVSDAVIKAKLWTGDEPRWSADGATLYVPLAPTGAYRSPVPAPQAARTREASGVTVMRSGKELAAEPAQAREAIPLAQHLLRENLAELAAIDVRSGRVTTLVPGNTETRPSVLRLSASGRWLTYLSVPRDFGVASQKMVSDLSLVPARGGTPVELARDLPQLGDYHRLNYSWHPTADQLVFFKDSALWLVDVGANGPAAPRQVGASLGPLAPTVHWFTRDGRALVVGTDPADDKDYGDVRPRGIAIVPLDGSPARRVAIDDRTWIWRGILKADERTVWQPDGQAVTVLLEARATGERAVVRLDPSSGGTQVLWRGRARVTEFTSGGGHGDIIGLYEDIATPPDLYAFTPDFSSKRRVSQADPRLAAVRTGSVETFETLVPRHDGTTGLVRSAVLLPPGAKRGDRLPGIVMMYPGGDVTREATTFGGGGVVTVPSLTFTSRGYAVILASLPLGPNREAGNPIQEMVDALLPQVYHAAELGYVDQGRLAVAGQSFGGYGTAAIVSRTNLFRAAVAVSGIYDLPGIYGTMDAQGGSFFIGWSENGQARMGTHPWADLKRYLDNSPYYQADKIFTPLMLVHGTADMAYTDAQKLFSALRRLDRPAVLASYEGQGHVIYEWKRASAIDAAERMVAFFRKHLGDPAAGQTVP